MLPIPDSNGATNVYFFRVEQNIKRDKQKGVHVTIILIIHYSSFELVVGVFYALKA